MSASPLSNDHDPRCPRLRFWGVRGSYPVSGPDVTTYGGATACIEVRNKDARFIVDAGTGIVALGREQDWVGVTRIDLLLTHLHHDHILGLPFFGPLHRVEVTLHIWCGNLDGECAGAALDRMFGPPLFPFMLGSAPAMVVTHGFKAGETLNIAGQRIGTAPLNHPSGATGYRFDDVGGSAAIITDIEHGDAGLDPAVVALCRRADTIVYDTMLQAHEYAPCRGWGHSTAEAGGQAVAGRGGPQAHRLPSRPAPHRFDHVRTRPGARRRRPRIDHGEGRYDRRLRWRARRLTRGVGAAHHGQDSARHGTLATPRLGLSKSPARIELASFGAACGLG